MPRPKGSKNRKPSVRRKGVANAESISEAKAAVATQIEALTSEVNEAAAALKAKKAELKDAQKQLAKIEKQEAALAEQAAQNQRKADAEKLATAFLESGAVRTTPVRSPITRPATVPMSAISMVLPTPSSRLG